MKTEANEPKTKEEILISNDIITEKLKKDGPILYNAIIKSMNEFSNQSLTAITKEHEADKEKFACEFAEWTQNNAHNKDEAYEMGIVLKNGEWIYAGDENTYTTPELLAQFREETGKEASK